jgi:hypothetical protein
MTNPTTPFSWQMPTSTDLVTDLPADFETFGQAVATSMADLLGGTTGQVLSKASNTNMDFTWVTTDDANAIQNTIVDSKGDLISATGSDVPARLAVGANGTVLEADSTQSTGLKYSGTWTTWSPTVNNISIGNGTISARYRQIGKLVDFNFKLTFGSTTTISGSPNFNLPVASAQWFVLQAGILDYGTGWFLSFASNATGTPLYFDLVTTNGTFAGTAGFSSTSSMTWGASDALVVNGSYEVA